mgnify:CR=1 FL=1
MAVTLQTSGTQAMTVGTEHSLASITVTGAFTFEVDLSAMVAGDIVELRVYKIILTAGTKRLLYFAAYYGAQPTHDLTKVSVPIGNELADTNSLECSIKQTFGTSRSAPWKILRYV